MESGKKHLRKGIKLLNKADIFLIICLLIISAVLFIRLYYSPAGGTVQVKIGDQISGEYALNEDRVIRINSGTVLEIKDGRYRLSESSCKNKLCVKQGWCSTQPIICVPQELIIANVSKKGNKQLLTY